MHAGDLQPITDGNDMVKYADDTYLVVPEVNSASCEDELKHIDQWATDNNIHFNQAKTVEIVFYARGRPSTSCRKRTTRPTITARNSTR